MRLFLFYWRLLGGSDLSAIRSVPAVIPELAEKSLHAVKAPLCDPRGSLRLSGISATGALGEDLGPVETGA